MSFYAELSFVAMNALGAVMGMTIVIGNHLTALVGLAVLPALASIIILLPLHETPRFLYLKRQNEERAIQAFKFYQNIGMFLPKMKIQTISFWTLMGYN